MLSSTFCERACECGALPKVLDYCQFGMPHRKRTCLWRKPGAFPMVLARKCPGNHKHKVTLSGWSVNKESHCPTSRGCSAYPLQLCDVWARAFSLHVFDWTAFERSFVQESACKPTAILWWADLTCRLHTFTGCALVASYPVLVLLHRCPLNRRIAGRLHIVSV